MQPCAGVDVSKEHLDWTVGEEGRVGRVSNTRAGVRALVLSLRSVQLGSVVVESTGGYERELVDELREAGVPVALVNPLRVRRFAEGLGQLAKTDSVDARVLALFGERARPVVRPTPGPEQRKLSSYAARRRQLIECIVAEKARLETADSWMKRDIGVHLRMLAKRIARIDELMDRAIAASPEMQARRELLEGVPCVGPGITRTLLVDLPELGVLTRRQIASLVGLAPYARDSGKKSGIRKVRGGRSAPRTALYLGAMVGARFNPVLKQLYDRLRGRGKPAKVAFVAVARKLLTILNAMVRDQEPWRKTVARAPT